MSAMSESKKMKLREQLEGKVKLLNETTWERRVPKDVLLEWISQFDEGPDIDTDEQTQVLFLLSHFLYFGQAEIRSLLKSLYRDMIRSPVLHEIRRANQDSLDASEIFVEYSKREQTFRFLALGNPSESSMHLLYYFRQENILPNNLFINPHEIFKPIINGTDVEWKLQFSDVGRYIFIDDMCGSGNQATQYLKDIVHPLKTLAPSLRVDYYVLFGTTRGLEAVRGLGGFDSVEAVFELDESFRSLEASSRIFQGKEVVPDRGSVRDTCLKHGSRLAPKHPLGYEGEQLLLAFNHNTPDNTLPIFWGGEEAENGPWKAVFRRYDKVY